MTRLTEGNGQNQALESSYAEVKFLTLALHFSLIFLFYACFNICLYVCSMFV